MALCSTPCSLAALPAELPAWLPERTVADLSGQDCPGWLAPWDSTGEALKTLAAARMTAMCTGCINFLSDGSWSNASKTYLFVLTAIFLDAFGRQRYAWLDMWRRKAFA